MCNMTNEVPQLFDWDQVRNQPGDRWARAELNQSCIEFVAPTEYMVRPPQPAVYVFLIDISHTAVQSGNLHYLRIFVFLYSLPWFQVWLPLLPGPFWRILIAFPTRMKEPKLRSSAMMSLSISSPCQYVLSLLTSGILKISLSAWDY